MTPLPDIIPYGFCHCGCGQKANPGRRFLFSHINKKTPRPEEAVPFKIDGVYCRLIPLTQGKFTIVWESDYLWLMQWSWHARYAEHTDSYYALRSYRVDEPDAILEMARLIAGTLPHEKADHRNRDTLHNNRSNLRKCSNQQNSFNQSISSLNTTGYKGVTRRKNGMYRARLGVNYKRKHLGDFVSLEAAARAYDDAALLEFGEFAALNFPKERSNA